MVNLGGFRAVGVELHKFGEIELGLLEDLDLTDEDVLKGEDLGALLGDLLADLVGEAERVIIIKDLQFLEEFFEGRLLALREQDFHHLLTDHLLLGSLGVASGLNLGFMALGERNGEHAEEVSVGGLGLNEALNERVPLLDESAGLVASDVHAVEVGVAVVAFHFFALDLDFAPGVFVGFTVQISERNLEDTAFQGVGRVLYVS